MNSPFPGPQAVRIVTDSSCDLPAAIADELGITIVPLTIRFGDEEFVDREELSAAEFWSRCVNSSKLPETAAPAPGQFEMHYRRLAAEGATGIVVVSLSGALSATMQSAQLAARSVQADDSVDLDIRVLDSRSITMGLGTIALACARLARDGATIDEVEATAIDLIERTRVFGALDTLENLKKGGRIGNAKALLATALADQADHRGDRRRRRAGRQAAHPLQGAGVPRRQGQELRRRDREPRRACTPTAAMSTPSSTCCDRSLPARSSSARSARSSAPTADAARSASPSRSRADRLG